MSSKAAVADEAPAAPAPTGPLTGPGRMFIACILAWFGGELLYALAINDRFSLLARYDNPVFEKPQVDDMAMLSDNFRFWALLVLAAAVVVFVVGWAMFVTKALANGKASGPSGGLAAVSIFIPILNLFTPYSALKAIWASTHPADTSGKAPSALATWQLTWVLANVLGILAVVFPLLIGAGKLPLYELHTFAQKDLFLAALGLWMGSAAMAGASAVLLINIVLKVMKADAATA